MNYQNKVNKPLDNISNGESLVEDKEKGIALSPPEFGKGNSPAQLKGKKAKLPKELQSKNGNPKAAKIALKELKAKQALDKKGRLADVIIDILVWGVAKPMKEGDSKGKEGIIGIHHAVNAADALIGMPHEAYMALLGKMTIAGFSMEEEVSKKASFMVENVLILKAVAARKNKYITKDNSAGQEVEKFADDIRGMDAEELKKTTSVRDHGDDKGLRQKYTMTCGPTSIQIVYGESDPVFALNVNKEGKNTLKHDNKVGDQQKALLNQTSAIPRLIKNRWKSFNSTFSGLTLLPEEVPKYAALLNYIGGNSFNAVDLAGGWTLAAKHGFTIVDTVNFKTHFPFNEPGMSQAGIQNAANSVGLDDVTNSTNTLTGQSGGVSNATLNTLWKQLFRGRDIAMAVLWNSGGGHAMTFTQAKGNPPKGGRKRKFLLSDPWTGKSEWLSSKNIKNGNFKSIGNGSVLYIST